MWPKCEYLTVSSNSHHAQLSYQTQDTLRVSSSNLTYTTCYLESTIKMANSLRVTLINRTNCWRIHRWFDIRESDMEVFVRVITYVKRNSNGLQNYSECIDLWQDKNARVRNSLHLKWRYMIHLSISFIIEFIQYLLFELEKPLG